MALDDHKRHHHSPRIDRSTTNPASFGSDLLLESREDDYEKEAELISSCRAAWLLAGDSGAQGFERWVALVRKRSGKYRYSGFPNRQPKMCASPTGLLHSLSSPSSCSSTPDVLDVPQRAGGSDDNSEASLIPDSVPETSLWERLGNASSLDIESRDFSWNMLTSLHHTEHTSSTEHSEDELNKAFEVTINSGGVVFFALFSDFKKDAPSREAAAVIKVASSRMATQSERLGYELAKWLGVKTPQARVIHSSAPDWQRIKDATEKARDMAITSGDESGEMTCSELLEALELSRCLLLMNYVHGSPVLESSDAFETRETAEKTAAALGRILVLDLVLRNEDRLPCRQLGWRGNPGNLIYADDTAAANINVLEKTVDSSSRRFQPRVLREIRKERRANSVDGRLVPLKPEYVIDYSDTCSESSDSGSRKESQDDIRYVSSNIIAIDSGVPRRPPAGKRARDQANYPKLVELTLNNVVYSSNLLYEITCGKLGTPSLEDSVGQPDYNTCFSENDMAAIVHDFRGGFRAAIRDLQGFHLFLLTLYQKLDGLLRLFLSIVNKNSGEPDKDDLSNSEQHACSPESGFSSPLVGKDRGMAENLAEISDLDLSKSVPKSPMLRGSPDVSSPFCRESWSGKNFKGCSMRMTLKFRDLCKFAKVEPELSKDLEQWNELFKVDVLKLCHENNFSTGFFEGTDYHIVVDAYELKVRLEHILERIALISDAANTERPSHIMDNLFIGGALAARSMHTLEHLGITHILCLCSNEIGQSDTQYPDQFDYENLSISDNEDAKIGDLFEVASTYIDHVVEVGGKVLVHCFEGRSRSATVVLAYLMLRKNLTLSEAWRLLKKAHRRAQPNDGFAKVLMELDVKLHGKASMEWQRKRPMMRVCPICGKNAGLSSSSLKLHLQKSHRKFSSGSVDSAMTLEIQKALDSLKISSNGSGKSIHDNKMQFNYIS